MTQREKIDIFPHWVIRDRDSESRSLPCFPPDFFQEFVGSTLALSDSMYIRKRLPDCPSTALDSSRQKCGFPGGDIRREQWITLGCKWDIGRGNRYIQSAAPADHSPKCRNIFRKDARSLPKEGALPGGGKQEGAFQQA